MRVTQDKNKRGCYLKDYKNRNLLYVDEEMKKDKFIQKTNCVFLGISN